MNVHRIDTAAHVAFLEPMTGQGKLVRPRPSADIEDPLAPGSLQEADCNRMVRELARRGWTLAEENGLPVVDYETADGREVVGLYGLDPVVGSPDVEQLGQAEAQLRAAVLGTE